LYHATLALKKPPPRPLPDRRLSNSTRRAPAPFGNHSNGTGVIENGIDLMRGSELDRALAFTVWNANIHRYGTRISRRDMCDLRTTADAGWSEGRMPSLSRRT